MGTTLETLAEGLLAGEKLAVARALNLVEDRRPAARREVAALLQRLDTASTRELRGQRIGLTGPPGAGKSTLAAELGLELLERGHRVGVIAVDPTSVHSRGSLLGDRARMSFAPEDPRVFVRSLATGGDAGGLSWAAPAAVRVLAAAYDTVIVETTGVGQTETEVRHVVDTVALVIQPGSGDSLQFIKAGVMEIPDLLVVNKADQEDLARRALSDLRSALGVSAAAGVVGDATRSSERRWELPILSVSARARTGVAALVDAILAHSEHLRPELSARRARGALAWTEQLFLKEHGEHGVRALGGARALRTEAEALLSSAPPPVVAQRLSARYLDHIRLDTNTQPSPPPIATPRPAPNARSSHE